MSLRLALARLASLRWSSLLSLVFASLLTTAAVWLAAGCGRADLDSLDRATLDAGGGGDDAGGDARVDTGPSSDGSLPDGAVLTSLAVSPPIASVAVGTSTKLRAIGTFTDGTTADLTDFATWTSDNGGVAAVSNGTVSAKAPGVAVIRAAMNGLQAAAKVTVPTAPIKTITVTPRVATTGVGGTIPYKATATLTDGTTQDVTATAVWLSTNTAVASISAGVAKALSPGQTTITATAGGVTGKASLTVNGATLVSIALSPTNPVVGVNVTFPFTATATFSDGSIADVTASATWATSSPANVAISTSGVASTLAPGTSIVSAAIGPVSGTTTVTVTPARLTSIAVTPRASTLPVNGSEQLIATGTYADGSTSDLTQSVTWSSSVAGIAAVSNAAGSQGRVTGISAGTATMTATLGAVSGQATVTVTAATLTSITVTPPNPQVPRLTTLPFIALGAYSDGSTSDITTSVGWSTDDANVATISNAGGSQGIASANNLGTTGVHATLNGVTGSTTITVTSAALVSISVTPANSTIPIGDKQLMRATGSFSDGSTADLTATAVWTTGDANIATISNASGAQGLLTAVSAGTTSVTATQSGVSGTTNVTVTTPVLQQVVVSPIDPSIPIGQRVQFTATAIYTNGTQRNVTAQSAWSSSNTGVATISGFGRATSVGAGTTTISATFQGMSGATTLTVTNAVVVSVQVTPIDPTLPVGTAQNFAATAIYSDNTSQNVTALSTWVSSNGSVAQVVTAGFQRGRVTAIGAGTAQISATYSGLTGSTNVTVSSATVVSISVSPAQVTAPVGTQRQFTAQAIYSDGSSRDVTVQATWFSSAPSVVGVNDAFQRGLAKALAPGDATLTAAWGGLSGTADFMVTGATLSSIQVTPIQPSVANGVPVQFAATAIFSDNTSQNVTGLATWESSNPAVARVSDAGGSKGFSQTLSPGTTTITAIWSGVRGSTTLTVTPATLTTIQITPFAPTIPVGFTTQLVATGIFSDNTTQDVTFLATWTSDAQNIASVSDAGGSKGRLSPLAPGAATIRAIYQGVTGTDNVTVSSATLQSIAISPATVTIARFASQPFTAVGTLSDGSTLDVTTYVTWFSSTPSIASISNAAGSQGVAKGLAAGSVTISAVRGGANGTASLTVQ